MSFEKFIARRYIRSKQQTLFINIIMLVSLAGVTVGVAALIIVLSVFNGFNKVVTDVLVGFDPHVRILPNVGKSFQLSDTLNSALHEAGVQGWSPYVESKALLVSKNGNRVAVVKGVDDSTIGTVSGVRQATVAGKFDFGNDGSGIVVGLSLADRLGIIVGSELTVVSPVGIDAMIVQYTEPEMRRFTVTGIYDSRNKEYDTHYAFISIEVARNLFQFPRTAVSGVEVRLNNIKEAEKIKLALHNVLGEKYSVLSWYDLHKDLYS
ncbi:MAG: ABC transporter permease, partial [bacterium]